MRTALALALVAAPLAAPPAALTLDDALAEASRGNPDLLAARSQREAAGVDLYQSYSGVLPRLDLFGGFGRRFLSGQRSLNVVPVPVRDPGTGYLTDLQFQSLEVPIPAADFADHQLNLVLRWTFFDGLASWSRIGSARALARAADRQVDEVALQVAFEVSRRFYEVVKSEQSLRVREETAARSEELVLRADALFAAGRGSKADTYAARVNLGNDRMAVEAQRAQLVRARADLAVALGRGPDAPLEVVPPSPLAGAGLPALEEPAPFESLLARARAGRPLLAQRRGQVEAADQEIARARGGYWPALGVEGNYLRQSTELTGEAGVLGDPSRQYVALARLTVTWNLFQGRETAAGIQRAEVQARRARVDADAAGTLVAAEIARARVAVVTLARSAAIAQDNLAAAGEGLRLARERLEAGAASQLEVRDATLKLAEAKLSLVNALVDHAVARADLNRAVGGTL